MGFDLAGAINSAAGWVSHQPIVGAIVNNPVFTALFVTAIAVVIVLALYHAQIKPEGNARIAQMTIYIFFAVVAILFVHHYASEKLSRVSAAQAVVRDVFNGIESSRELGLGTSFGFGAAPPAGAIQGGGSALRADNVASDETLHIEDVVVPLAVGASRQ